MSAFGPKRTSLVAPHTSAFGDKTPALSGLSSRGEFDPAQGRVPSREVRFKSASDPSSDRSHSAVLLVSHGPHFHLAPGENNPPGVDFSVALADADGRSEAIAGLLVSRSIGQQRCPINGGTDGLGHALNRSIHRGDTRRTSCRRIRCEAGEKNVRTLGAGWLRPRPVFKKRYSATQMAGREPVEPVPRQYWPEALRRTRVGRLRETYTRLQDSLSLYTIFELRLVASCGGGNHRGSSVNSALAASIRTFGALIDRGRTSKCTMQGRPR